VCDSIVVVVQPASGDVLQFLKAGIMEVPDILVVTKADLGDAARRAQRDLEQALAALGSSDVPVIPVSSVPPPSGIPGLADALEAHRERIDVAERRLHARRASALREFTAEHGEGALRALGGRRDAERLLAAEDPTADVSTLIETLKARA
jgi:LAO/AO transport system kinase